MGKPAPPVLYHYTSEMYLGMILTSGHLRLTESNIGYDGSGPRVVWLTTTRDPGGNGLDGGFGKGRVKITIDASGLPLHHWPTWSFEQGIEPVWYDALDSAGGGGSENWWVCTREIPLDRFLSIEVDGVPVHDFAKGRIGSLQSTGSIKDYLGATVKMREMMREQGGIARDWKYVGIDHLILDNGRRWSKVSKDLPEGLKRGKMGDCYSNAFDAARANPDLTYVEGYAQTSFMPLMHAWVVDRSGTVYDPTWEHGTSSEYFGVPLSTDFVGRVIVQQGHYSVFGGDVPGEILKKALREGLPSNALRRVASLVTEAARPEGTTQSKTVTIGDDEIVLCYVPKMVSGESAIWAGMVTVSGREHEVGYLTWSGTTIGGVYVAEFLRRQGVATAMLAYAREFQPGLKHSTTLLPDGRAWSQAVASLQTEAMPVGPIQPDVTYDETKAARANIIWARCPTCSAESHACGFIRWYGDGEIAGVKVVERHRRRGLATELLSRARTFQPNVHHSETLSDDGVAWSQVAASLAKTADEDQCPFCAGDSLMADGVYTCEDGHVWHPDSPEAQAFHGDGPLSGQPLQQFGEFWPIVEMLDPSTRTASATLPEGYALQHVPGAPNGTRNHSVVATFEGRTVGAIQWVGAREVRGGQRMPDGTTEQVLIKRPPQIVDLKVYPEHQRKGLATAMYQMAKQHEPDLTHDDIVLPDGEAWMRSLGAAEQQVEVSGVALVARDTGRVLFLQRALCEGDDNGGKWEFPGGHHEEGDTTSLHAAIREWEEEVGQRFPEGGEVINTWTSPDGIYRGHVVAIAEEAMLALHVDRVVDNPDEDGFEQAAWWAIEDAKKNPALREECKKTPWDLLKVPVLDKTAHKEGSTMDTPDEFGSLFDDIPVDSTSDPLTAAAAQHTAEWGFDLPYDNSPGVVWASPTAPHPGLGHTMTPGFEGFMEAPAPAAWTVDEDPEAALPVTYGDGEDEDEMAQQVAAALGSPRHVARQPQETEEERGRRLLAYVDASLRGEEVAGPNPFAHIGAGQADNEIAAAAANHLATKTALRTYDPAERQAIIDEGIEVRAGNLDRLDISGTHYEALAATAGRAVPEDEDLTFLDGDPNLSDF